MRPPFTKTLSVQESIEAIVKEFQIENATGKLLVYTSYYSNWRLLSVEQRGAARKYWELFSLQNH